MSDAVRDRIDRDAAADAIRACSAEARDQQLLDAVEAGRLFFTWSEISELLGIGGKGNAMNRYKDAVARIRARQEETSNGH